jgi:pSer/pThr/pTyr-binding forkhead associated (FHA) protein
MNTSQNKFCAACGYNLGMAAAPAPAAAPVAPAPVAAGAGAQVVLTALRADGSEAGSFPLPGPIATVGRDVGGIFAGDSYLSPRHATFAVRGAKVFVKDESSLNGVYLKLTPQLPVELRSGDVFRIGQEIIRFELLMAPAPTPDGVERLGSPSKGYIGRVSLVIGRDTSGNSFPVPEHGIHFGRERGDILFPEDGYVSGLHCRVGWENGRAYLLDTGSSNGTFIRLLGERELKNNDTLLMGQQLFRVNF